MIDPRIDILRSMMQGGAMGNSVFGQQQPMGQPQMIQGSEMPKMPQMQQPQMQQPGGGGTDMTDIMDMFFGG